MLRNGAGKSAECSGMGRGNWQSAQEWGGETDGTPRNGELNEKRGRNGESSRVLKNENEWRQQLHLKVKDVENYSVGTGCRHSCPKLCHGLV